MIHFPHLPYDVFIVKLFNQFCGKSIFWDTLSLIFLSVDALRTAILVALIIGIWEYGKAKKDINSNKRVLAILFSIVLTLGIIEILNALIESPRPIVTYKSSINSPIITENTQPLWKNGWVRNPKHGSFPSDTVALLASMAIGLFLWNRILGIFAIIFVIFAGILPRLYFGLHYPSDMILGFLIAVFSSFIVERVKFFDLLSLKILDLQSRHPYTVGVIGFYLAYIISEKFILIRKLPIWLKTMFGY